MFTKIYELLKVVFKFPSYSTIHNLFDYLSKVSLKMFYTSISVIAFYIFVSSLLTSQFTMKPFSIPGSFSSDGYSGEILSREIMDRFNQITRETKEMKSEDKEDQGSDREDEQTSAKKDTSAAKNKFISDINAISFSNGLENLDVEVLGLGLSVGKLSEYIRILLGVEVKKITGELIKKDNTLVLNMRLTGYTPLNFVADIEGTDYEKIKYLEEKAALALKKYFSPLELAFYLYKKERYEEAIEAADYAIDNEEVGNKHWAHYIKAQSEIEQDEHYDHAYEYFDEATKNFSGFVEAWYNWGYYLYSEGRHQEAIEKFEHVLRIDEKHKNALVYWGNCLFSLDRFDEAIAKHKKAVEYNPDDEYALYALAFDLRYIGRYEEGIEYYEKAIDFEPENTSHYWELADCYFYAGDTTMALNTYLDGKNTVTSYKEQKKLYKKWAAFSLLVGREQEAISIMNQYFLWEDINQENDETLVDIYIELESDKFYRKKIKYYKEMIDMDRKSYYFTNLAYLYSRIGQYDSAIHYYNEYYRIYVGRTKYYLSIAANYVAKGDFESAKSYYQIYHNKEEDHSISSFVSWGMTLLRNNEVDEAMEKFKSARDFSIGTTAEVYHGMALASEATGKDQLALSYYYQALDKEDIQPLMLMEYANLLEKNGRKEEAQDMLDELLLMSNFASQYTIKTIYMERGVDVTQKYCKKLIEISEKKGRLYTLLAYVHALEGNDTDFYENMEKASAEGFPIKGQMKYFPFNKLKYTERMNAMIDTDA